MICYNTVWNGISRYTHSRQYCKFITLSVHLICFQHVRRDAAGLSADLCFFYTEVATSVCAHVFNNVRGRRKGTTAAAVMLLACCRPAAGPVYGGDECRSSVWLPDWLVVGIVDQFAESSVWCGAVVQRVRHLGLRSVVRGFKSCSRQRCVTTVGKLLTPMCLCHQAV